MKRVIGGVMLCGGVIFLLYYAHDVGHPLTIVGADVLKLEANS